MFRTLFTLHVHIQSSCLCVTDRFVWNLFVWFGIGKCGFGIFLSCMECTFCVDCFNIVSCFMSVCISSPVNYYCSINSDQWLQWADTSPLRASRSWYARSLGLHTDWIRFMLVYWFYYFAFSFSNTVFLLADFAKICVNCLNILFLYFWFKHCSFPGFHHDQ